MQEIVVGTCHIVTAIGVGISINHNASLLLGGPTTTDHLATWTSPYMYSLSLLQIFSVHLFFHLFNNSTAKVSQYNFINLLFFIHDSDDSVILSYMEICVPPSLSNPWFTYLCPLYMFIFFIQFM
ncbi:hypothetical protein ACOSP7_016344 [Xanthoceras sorbifolium]